MWISKCSSKDVDPLSTPFPQLQYVSFDRDRYSSTDDVVSGRVPTGLCVVFPFRMTVCLETRLVDEKIKRSFFSTGLHSRCD